MNLFPEKLLQFIASPLSFILYILFKKDILWYIKDIYILFKKDIIM